MEPDVYVLRPYMIHLVLRKIDSIHAIVIDLQQIMFNPQVIEQSLEPYCLLHRLRHGHVLGLCNRNAMVDCRIERQLTGAWDNVNAYPVVDQYLSRSPA